MRIVVTGRAGQVASALHEYGSAIGHDIILLGRPQFDLESGADGIAAALAAARPDVIVSAAAYTAVDQAETDADRAFAVNAVGAGAVARGARALDVPILHLSTDYVFDGVKPAAYVEADPAAPQTVYGASKLAGEQRVLSAQPNGIVLRTAGVFSPFGDNFVKTMLRLAADRDEIAVVGDQVGNPTSAFSIAMGLVTIAQNLIRDRDSRLRGTFHMAGGAAADWATLAEAVFAISGRLGGPTARVRRIGLADRPAPAHRPLMSQLDCTLLEKRHGVALDPWQNSLGSVVERLVTPTGIEPVFQP